MNRVILPENTLSNGRKRLGTFESGSVICIPDLGSDGTIPDQTVFGMVVDADPNEPSILILDLFSGKLDEYDKGVYALPCPAAEMRAKIKGCGDIRMKIVTRDRAGEKRSRIVDINPGTVFAKTGGAIICRDGEKLPALCMKTDRQCYTPNDDRLTTCVDLLEGTEFEINAYEDGIDIYETSLYPYGYGENGKICMTHGEKAAPPSTPSNS